MTAALTEDAAVRHGYAAFRAPSHDAIALCEDVRPQRCAKEYAVKSGSSISRRALISGGGALGSLLAIPGAARAGAVQPSAATTPDVAPATASVYEAIGVRPLINARGTYTIISGSTMLPEVRAAMDAAAQHYVHLDELTEAIGARLATLTGAEWGMVSNGCSAGLTLATAACVAGGNPDLHVRLPEPERLSQGRSRSSRRTRATSTTRRCAPSACVSSRWRRSPSSRRRSARGPR